MLSKLHYAIKVTTILPDGVIIACIICGPHSTSGMLEGFRAQGCAYSLVHEF